MRLTRSANRFLLEKGNIKMLKTEKCTRVWLLALIWIVYLKYCSALTFLTTNVRWIKLAFPAALGPDTSTHAAGRFRRAPNSESNFPGVPPPRCASQTSDPPGLRLPCCCTDNLRRRYASLQNHPRSTRDSRRFTVTAFGKRRAAGPGAGEGERFGCGSPSARHRSGRF